MKFMLVFLCCACLIGGSDTSIPIKSDRVYEKA